MSTEVAISNFTSMHVHTCIIFTKWLPISALLVLVLSLMKSKPCSGRRIMIWCSSLLILPSQLCMLLQAHTSPLAQMATMIWQSIPHQSCTEGRQVPPNGTSKGTSENRTFTLICRHCWCFSLPWPRSCHGPHCTCHSLLLLLYWSLLLVRLRSWWHCCVISTHPLNLTLQDPIYQYKHAGIQQGKKQAAVYSLTF